MLRLSKKADYALMAMKHLALRGDRASSSAREIAEQYDIPIELRIGQTLRSAQYSSAGVLLHSAKCTESSRVSINSSKLISSAGRSRM